jgi:hypothetical protein
MSLYRTIGLRVSGRGKAVLPTRSIRRFLRTRHRLSRDNVEEATINYLFQVDKGVATRRAIFDVFPLRLIGDDRNVGEFKEPIRFDVIHHFIAPCCFVVVGYPELWAAE